MTRRTHSVGYFVNWGIYARGFKPEHIPVDDLTHILYCALSALPLTSLPLVH